MKPRHRKKRRETKEDRFSRDTKDYKEAARLNLWNVERKYGDEIMEAVKELGLPYKLDRLTKDNCDSFFIAVLQQLKSERIYESLSEDNKIIADQFHSLRLRHHLCDFMMASVEPKVLEFQKKFEKLRPENGDWIKYWQKSKGDVTTTYWDHQAMAWYLKRDIRIIRIRKDSEDPFEVNLYAGNLGVSEGSQGAMKPLLIGQKTDLHFQSLIEDDKANSSEQEVKECEDESGSEDETIDCPNCQKKFKHLLKHVDKSKCKNKIEAKLIQDLKDKAIARNKARNTEIKAQSRKRLQMHESFDDRKYRLQKKSEIMKALRERKRKSDYEKLKNSERESKQLSRVKQKEADPDYERPRFKHTIQSH